MSPSICRQSSPSSVRRAACTSATTSVAHQAPFQSRNRMTSRSIRSWAACACGRHSMRSVFPSGRSSSGVNATRAKTSGESRYFRARRRATRSAQRSGAGPRWRCDGGSRLDWRANYCGLRAVIRQRRRRCVPVESRRGRQVLTNRHEPPDVEGFGAGDRDRTGDIELGKLAFYR
jgi:hypothetical protein